VQEEGYDPVIPEGADEETVRAKLAQFVEKAHEWGDRIPTGILLVNRNVSTFEERIAERIPDYRSAPPAKRPIADHAGRSVAVLDTFFEELAVES